MLAKSIAADVRYRVVSCSSVVGEKYPVAAVRFSGIGPVMGIDRYWVVCSRSGHARDGRVGLRRPLQAIE